MSDADGVSKIAAGDRRTQALLVSDADGVSKIAAGDRRTQALLVSARDRDARVVASAVPLTEVLHGTARCRDASCASRVTELPVAPEIGRQTGTLLGTTGLSETTVDAIVATTAAERHARGGDHGEMVAC